MTTGSTITLQHVDVLRRLERQIEVDGSLRGAARSLKISPQYLSAILGSTRLVGPKVLKVLGLRRRIQTPITYTEAARAPRRKS